MSVRAEPGIDETAVAAFRSDGAVCLRNALSSATLSMAREMFEWSLTHPGPGASELPSKGTGTFYQDLANPAALRIYEPLVRSTEVGDILASLWDQPDVWFMYEQVFRKEGGETRRSAGWDTLPRSGISKDPPVTGMEQFWGQPAVRPHGGATFAWPPWSTAGSPPSRPTAAVSSTSPRTTPSPRTSASAARICTRRTSRCQAPGGSSEPSGRGRGCH